MLALIGVRSGLRLWKKPSFHKSSVSNISNKSPTDIAIIIIHQEICSFSCVLNKCTLTAVVSTYKKKQQCLLSEGATIRTNFIRGDGTVAIVCFLN